MDLYFEMYSGIAGDMVIGALLDLGGSRDKLEKSLSSMNFGNYDLVFERCMKKGIDAYNFDVILKDEHSHEHNHEHSHDHSHEHSHDHSHEHSHDHSHEHSHDHSHEHSHNHSHEHIHEHHHRNLNEIFEVIDSGDFSDKVKSNAKKIFNIVADAEAVAHGVKKEEVHFHEVGAVDSIIDIVGVCVLIEDLNPNHIYATELYEGKGIIKCAHGAMPIPAPAVLNIIKQNDLTLNIIDDFGEHITPTGASIVACFSEGEPEFSFNVKKVGLGAGNREFENTTNILRVMEIEDSKKKH